MPGRPALWLLACTLSAVLPLSGSTAPYQLGLVADGGACLMKTSWGAGCSTLTNQGIPAITVGLFTSGGVPCCGQTPVSVHVTMRQGDREVALSGYRDRDSSVDEQGSAMRVTFSGLSPVDPAEAGRLNLTLSAFYEGVSLSVTREIVLLPDGLALMPPWGVWGAPLAVVSDSGPWTVHAPLPPFAAVLTSLDSTQARTRAEDKLEVGVRLFDRSDKDISAASLVGATMQTAVGGVATFSGLSITGVAGGGLRVVFFLVGSGKECTMGVPRSTCEAWEERRGGKGGLGGYWVELASPKVAVVPDRMTLEVVGLATSTTQPVVRVDDFLPHFRVSFSDSAKPGVPLSQIASGDMLTLSIRLIDQHGVDVTSVAIAAPVTATMGSTTASIVAGVADFRNLKVVNRSGKSFRLLFTPSWHPRCVDKLMDVACAGECCIYSQLFTVFPYASRVNPPSVGELLDGTAASQEFAVELLDSSSNILTGVATPDGLRVQAYLLQRGKFVYDRLAGTTLVAVDSGVAMFTDLSVVGNGGSGLAFRFDEVSSLLSASTLAFSVFPLAFDSFPTVGDAEVGAPLQDIAIRLLGADGKVMSSVTSGDAFMVGVAAQKFLAATEVWEACAGCLQARGGGVLRVAADLGVATFRAESLNISGSVGRFRLVFTLARGSTFPGLLATSNNFSVDAGTIVVVPVNGSTLPVQMDLTGTGTRQLVVGDALGNVTLALGDALSSPLLLVALADNIEIQMELVQRGKVLSAATLAGVTRVKVDGGLARFSGVTVQGVAGTGFQQRFSVASPPGGSGGLAKVTLLSRVFSITADHLTVGALPSDVTTDAILAAIPVTLLDAQGLLLTNTSLADGLRVKAELWAVSRSCVVSPNVTTIDGRVGESITCPETGCSDGTDDFVFARDVVGCDAAWTTPGLLALGAGSAGGACSDGWAICPSAALGATSHATALGLTFALCDSVGAGDFYVTQQASSGCYSGLSAGNDMWGCGGAAGNAASTQCGTSLTKSVGSPDFGTWGGMSAHTTAELSNVIKTGISGGGVMCCRDVPSPHPTPPSPSTSLDSSEVGCDAAYVSLVNVSSLLRGTLHRTVLAGVALFADLRVTGAFGARSLVLRFTLEDSIAPDASVLSPRFTVDPPRIIISGFTGETIAVSDTVFPLVSAANDNNQVLAHVEDCPYNVSVSLEHHGQLSAAFLPRTSPVNGSVAAFNLSFSGIAGSNFALLFTLPALAGERRVRTTPFTILPDTLALSTGQVLGGYTERAMPTLRVLAQDMRGTTITSITALDTFTISLTLRDAANTPVPPCSSSSAPPPGGCLAGATTQAVLSGEGVFPGLALRAAAGSGYRFLLRLSTPGGDGPELVTQTFSVAAGALRIVEGETLFDGSYWVSNRGVGEYAVALFDDSGALVDVQLSHGFNVTASLLQRGEDVSSLLEGARVQTANLDLGRGVHAVFSDLVVAGAGSDLSLVFTFLDAQSGVALNDSTAPFLAVPYALRIDERCYNGVRPNTSAPVPYGHALLECAGADPGAPADLGAFGYLTGYYYYTENRYIGPLLRNLNGLARIPPITVLATDLYQTVESRVEALDKMYLIASLFTFSGTVGDSRPLGGYLTGTARVLMDQGQATFSDLVVTGVPDCSVNCSILLRFSLDGALCQDTWCTNVTLTVRDATIDAPHLLGSHPAFPGDPVLSGSVRIANLAVVDFDSDIQDVLVASILAVGGVSVVDESSVTVGSASLFGGGVAVAFSVVAPTHAAAAQMVTRLTLALLVTERYAGADTFLLEGCAALGDVAARSARAQAVCNSGASPPYTVSLPDPIERSVISEVMDSRAATPILAPKGSSAACAASGGGVSVAPLASAFSGASLTISGNPGATLYYTVDSCPVETDACYQTGSVLSVAASSSASSGDAINIITTSPTATALPVALQHAAVAANALGVTGTRTTGALPRVLTVRAFAAESGKRTSLTTANTFALPPQAETPSVNLTVAEVWTLGWCSDALSLKSSDSGTGTSAGTCADIHTVSANTTSVCNSAVAVPCATGAVVCSAGALSRTVPVFGYYDGLPLFDSPASVLSLDYGPGQTEIFVASAAAMGFTNHGELVQHRRIRAGGNGASGSGFPPLTVTSVDQTTNILTLLADITTTLALAGSPVEVIEECEVAANVTNSATLPISSPTPSSTVYFTLDGSAPSAGSFILGASGRLSVSLPANVTAVAAGEGRIDSFELLLMVGASCGNGVIDGREQCDDGNTVDGDSCSSICLTEI